MDTTVSNSETQSYMVKVFGWMTGALALTAAVAAFVASNPSIYRVILGNQILFFGILISELVLVGYLSFMVKRISAMAATGVFLGYAALNGVTFSLIFLIYTASSIAYTFMITAAMFGCLSLFGYLTKADLSKVGSIAFMALIGLIIASLVNFFLNSEMLYWITSYAGVIIFSALTAYDIQKIKQLNILGNAGTEEDHKESIMGALTLYLDFINLFLFLLRFMGKRK